MLSLSRLAAKVGSAFLAYFTVSLCFCRTQERVHTHAVSQSRAILLCVPDEVQSSLAS